MSSPALPDGSSSGLVWNFAIHGTHFGTSNMQFSADIMGSVRAAFFGFQVGDVTISLSSIIVSALLFGLGFAITRIIQNWLDGTFLPATELDAGLRNSIRTALAQSCCSGSSGSPSPT